MSLFAMFKSAGPTGFGYGSTAEQVTEGLSLAVTGLGEVSAPPPPPSSWAARPDADVAIWSIAMPAGAQWTVPAAKPRSNRMLYLFRGNQLRVGSQDVRGKVGIRLRPDAAMPLVAGMDDVELLLLQGRPIGEPVVAHGPAVMNSRAEIQQAIADYQRTDVGAGRGRAMVRCTRPARLASRDTRADAKSAASSAGAASTFRRGTQDCPPQLGTGHRQPRTGAFHDHYDPRY